MSKIPILGESKPKKFSLTKDQISEFSYIATQRTAAIEIMNFWEKRLDHFIFGVRSSLAIEPEMDVNWNDAFVDGTITVTKKKAKEEVPNASDKKL